MWCLKSGLKCSFLIIAPVCLGGILLVCATPLNAKSNTVPELELVGAPSGLADNIRAHIDVAEESCVINGPQQQLLLGNLKQKVQRAAQAVGYYHLRYTHELIQTSNCWNLALNIEPGEPVIIENIDIVIEGEGRLDPAFLQYLKKDLPVKAGDRLDHGRYEKIKNEFVSIATSHGYFFALFTVAELRIDASEYRADIVLHFDSGQKMQFGQVHYPETVLSAETLGRYTTFETGDAYNEDRLHELQRALDDSQYFDQVRVQPKPEEAAGGQVPVDVELSSRKQHAYQFGVGASTDTGPRTRFSYENRYLNDRGHRLKYDLILSPVRSETKFNYMLPLAKPATQHLDLYTGFLTEETDTSRQDLFTLGAGYTRTSKRNWLQTIFLNFQREDFEVAGTKERIDLLIPGISWSKLKTDDPLYPLYGWRLQSKLRAANENLGSDISFYQAYAAVKTVYKLGPGRILLRLEGGVTEVDDFDRLPASVRFFAGGDNSVRGYDYQSLGPVDENGEVIGGANLLVGSVEYDIRVGGRWALAVFYDRGNAFNDGQVDYKRGVGIGLRWLSPIGPIRVDVARALDNDDDIQLHLSMGPDL